MKYTFVLTYDYEEYGATLSGYTVFLIITIPRNDALEGFQPLEAEVIYQYCEAETVESTEKPPLEASSDASASVKRSNQSVAVVWQTAVDDLAQKIVQSLTDLTSAVTEREQIVTANGQRGQRQAGLLGFDSA